MGRAAAPRAHVDGATAGLQGYPDGTFQPREGILRAQSAALIARVMGWAGEEHGDRFSDRGAVDATLWRAVNTLAHFNVARAYDDGTYKPTVPVAHAEVISFVTRAMVAQGYWQLQPNDPALYPNVPVASGHRADIATFVRYAGVLPGTTATGQGWAEWSRPAPRAWFADALWRALVSHFGPCGVPCL